MKNILYDVPRFGLIDSFYLPRGYEFNISSRRNDDPVENLLKAILLALLIVGFLVFLKKR